MSINDVRRYAVVDISPVEDRYIRLTEGEQPAAENPRCRNKMNYGIKIIMI